MPSHFKLRPVLTGTHDFKNLIFHVFIKAFWIAGLNFGSAYLEKRNICQSA